MGGSIRVWIPFVSPSFRMDAATSGSGAGPRQWRESAPFPAPAGAPKSAGTSLGFNPTRSNVVVPVGCPEAKFSSWNANTTTVERGRSRWLSRGEVLLVEREYDAAHLSEVRVVGLEHGLAAALPHHAALTDLDAAARRVDVRAYREPALERHL